VQRPYAPSPDIHGAINRAARHLPRGTLQVVDDDTTHDLEAATRALEAELRARDASRPMTDAELNSLVECGVGLERAIRRAQEAGAVNEPPGFAEAIDVWDRGRQFIREHEPPPLFGTAKWTDAAGGPGQN
jgi:hypothetical protein